MIENMNEIQKSEVETNVRQMFDENYRLITMSCVDEGEHFSIIYHFGKEYEMKHFRIKLGKQEELNSISDIYFSALLVENEIKDLFGVNIKGIAIDYDGKLLLSDGSPYAPMCNVGEIEIEVKKGNE